MGFRGGFWVLFCNWTRREPTGTIVELQRVHVARVGVQVATIHRAARNRRPIVTDEAEAARTTIEGAIARNREVDTTCLAAACPEIMTKVVLESHPIVCTINIEL